MEVELRVQEHHVEQLAARPTVGLLELIWNGLDANASRVEVRLSHNELGGVDQIEVADDGHGMTFHEAQQAFADLGESWKLGANRTREDRRALHGQHGKGRFRAAGIGQEIRWVTVAEKDGKHERTTVVIHHDSRRKADLQGPEDTTEGISTTVVISGFAEPPEGIGDGTAEDLLRALAPYIEEYHPTIIYDGEALDPSEIQVDRDRYDIEAGGETAALDVIEWSTKTDRFLYLCNEDGMALEEMHAGIQAPGFQFTAYLRWAGFDDAKRLAAPELDPKVQPLLEESREQLRHHYREWASDSRRAQVDEWKAEEVYPFEEEEPADETAKAARDLFDVVAVTAREAVNAGSTENRRFSLGLLREAIEQDPGSLRRVLENVLDLPKEKLKELDELLSQTTLTNVIAVSRSIANRLDFLKALDEMVHDADLKKRVLERKELHRILASETWVFGEEFALTADDEDLNTVLRRHVKELGREELAPEAPPVEDVSAGRESMVLDLLLARQIPQTRNRSEHLVVELKRPAQPIGNTEAQQIKDYALAVSKDARFEKSDVEWDFIAVSTKLGGTVPEEVAQKGQPPGLLTTFNDGSVRVWVRTWGEVIADAEHRLKYVKEHLDYDPTAQQAFTYLRERHADFLPQAVVELQEAAKKEKADAA